MENLLSFVGKKVRSIRKAKSLTQEDLAEKAGVHRDYIGGLERGERNVSLASLEKILFALNISIEDFFSFQTENKLLNQKEQILEELNQQFKIRSIKDLETVQRVSKEIFELVDFMEKI
ncbi:helix-turn-helix domain-containing protein [Aneurinibacillus sp. REN35]|uniref:helix-turn-helix domain-containing protein n=1 Tax=Aneurinibacillus sp. REN35 TaxID=3237286 RepID=UPI0035281CDD